VWFNNDCVRRTAAAEVTSLGVSTDTDFKEAVFVKIREAVREFRWGGYGLDYVAETIGDAEEWLDDLSMDIVYAVEETTNSWKEKQ
jgi:hypothetical protein